MHEIVDIFCSLNYDLRTIYCTNERRLVNLGELSKIKRELSATEYGYLVEAKIVTDLMEHKERLLKQWKPRKNTQMDHCMFALYKCYPSGNFEWKTEVLDVLAQERHNGPVYDFSLILTLESGKTVTIFINVKSHSNTSSSILKLCSFKEFVNMLNDIKNNEICVLVATIAPLRSPLGNIEIPQKHMIYDIQAYNVKWVNSIRTDGNTIYINLRNYPKLPDVPWRYMPNPVPIEEYYTIPSAQAFNNFLEVIEK